MCGMVELFVGNMVQLCSIFFDIRFYTYETQTLPVIEHYQKLGLVKKIQAIKSPEEVSGVSFQLLLSSVDLL